VVRVRKEGQCGGCGTIYSLGGGLLSTTLLGGSSGVGCWGKDQRSRGNEGRRENEKKTRVGATSKTTPGEEGQYREKMISAIHSSVNADLHFLAGGRKKRQERVEKEE